MKKVKIKVIQSLLFAEKYSQVSLAVISIAAAFLLYFYFGLGTMTTFVGLIGLGLALFLDN